MLQEGKSGTGWDEYRACLNETQSRDLKDNGDAQKKTQCLNRLEQACKAADYRVAKVLRLGFVTVEQLLKRIPSLNVIYLTRDPRAIINSRVKTSWFPVSVEKPKTVLRNIQSLCLKMEKDIASWKKARVMYKDRILHTTLTKLASKLTAFPEVYAFMNKEVTKAEKRKIIQYIYKNWENNITEKWRTELNPSFERDVERHCYYVIKHMK